MKWRISYTFTSLIIAIVVYIISYLACELYENLQSVQQNDYTLISKTIQLMVATPINIFYCILIVKFCKMAIYLQQTMNGLERPDPFTKAVLISVALIFILHYIADIFLYTYPYIILYGYQVTFTRIWAAYPLF